MARHFPRVKPPWDYRGGHIGFGWAPEEKEDEIYIMAVSLFKSTLDKVFNIHKERHQEIQNAIKEIKK